MNLHLILGLILSALSALMVNLAYLREHDAAAALPELSLRRPGASIRSLVESRAWLTGLAIEATGFAAFAAAVALAPLALVQSLSAGGIALLAFVSRRRARHPPARRERVGLVVAIVGLVALGVSLAGSSPSGSRASLLELLAWLLGSVALAGLVLALLTPRVGSGTAYGLAAGLLLACGDVSTKVALADNPRPWMIAPAFAFYGIGTSCLQIAYQHGDPLRTAGIATLLTNAIPIVAATTILHEGIPTGALGALRILAFAAVIVGAVALTRPEGQGRTADAPAEPVRDPVGPAAS